jgi:hypothetical protein
MTRRVAMDTPPPPELPYREGGGMSILDAPMAFLSIQDLCRPRGVSAHSGHRTTPMSPAEQQRRLLTLLQQAQLGLDYQPILDQHPDLQPLVEQIQTLMPAAFTTPARHLHLQRPIQAPLTLDETTHWIQATVNLGYRRGIPKLIDWAIRKPRPSRADAVKLWVAAEHFHQTEGLNLNQLKLVIVALSLSHPPQSLVMHWNRQRHHQTQTWICQQLKGEGQPNFTPPVDPTLAACLDIRKIPEVAL